MSDMFSPGTGALSNAAKSKGAAQKTDAALEASKGASNDDWRTHQAAASAHRDAQWAHQDAGNGTRALAHKAQADVHQEKAHAGQRAEEFAKESGTNADALSKKADKAQFGPDPTDPRTPQQLHQDAAQAHEQASKAHEIAGDKPGAAYHAAKADAHQRLSE